MPQFSLVTGFFWGNVRKCFPQILALKLHSFSDTKISERHLLLKSTIDTLPEEDEAYNLAKLLSWVFFPVFVVLALCQMLLFNLFNDDFHPFVEILKGANTQGKYCKNKLNQYFELSNKRWGPNKLGVGTLFYLYRWKSWTCDCFIFVLNEKMQRWVKCI